MTVFYMAGRGLARFCFSVLGRLEVQGRENVPPFGPLVVVANHISNNDPPALAVSLPRPAHFLGKKELFRNLVVGWALRGWQVHPIDRSSVGLDAIRIGLELLARDYAVVVFPEGHRSPNHALQEGLSGAAYLALKCQAPILPVGISGTEKFPGWRMPLPLCRFRVNIGQPFTFPVIEGAPSRAVLNSLRDIMMRRIADLLPPEYQGVYARPAANLSQPRSEK